MLDEGNKTWTADTKDLILRMGGLDFLFVGSRTREHLAALGHADDFKIMAVADGFFSQDRNRIARRNQSLDVAVREVVGHLVHETDDILTGPVAIGRIERIAQKDEMFMGHELLQAAQDCQSANSAIQALLTDGWQGNCFHITKE